MEKSEQPKTAEANGSSDALAQGKPAAFAWRNARARDCPAFRSRQAGPDRRDGFRSRRTDPAPRDRQGKTRLRIRDPRRSRGGGTSRGPGRRGQSRRAEAEAHASGARRATARLRRPPNCRSVANGRSSSSALPCCSPSARHCFIAACGPSPSPRLRLPPSSKACPPRQPRSRARATPDAGDGAPAAGEPTPETPAAPATPGSGSSELDWQPEVTPAPNDAADAGSNRNFTDVAKSPYQQPVADETQAQAQPASLTQDQTPALPPGVVFAVEDPSMGLQGQAPAAACSPCQPLPRCR